MTLIWAMLALLLWLLIGLVGLVLLLVVVPIGLRAEGEIGDEQTQGAIHLSWGLGLLGVRVCSSGGVTLHLFGGRVWRFALSRRSKEERAEAKQRRRDRKRDRTEKRGGGDRRDRSGSRGLALFSLRGTAWQLLTRLLGTFALRGRAGGIVGTGDPVDTVALRAALIELERRVGGLELSFEYDFVDEVLEVWADARGRIWLAHTIVVLVPFLFKRDTWRLLRAARA